MKKIINGKVYDTKTAKMVTSWSHADSQDENSDFTETLFRKRTGEYFLYGEGGSCTRYAVPIGQNEWKFGRRIEPLSYISARKWAENNMTKQAFSEEFGEIDDASDDRVVLSVSVSKDIADRIRREAQKKGMSVSATIASKFCM